MIVAFYYIYDVRNYQTLIVILCNLSLSFVRLISNIPLMESAKIREKVMLFDIIIKNVEIVDGTNGPAYYADLAIKQDRIAKSVILQAQKRVW